MTAIWGVVYAAGYGRRFGGYKQFETIRGEQLVQRCVRVLQSVCEHVVVVLPPGHPWPDQPGTTAVAGGATNPESVRNGVAAVAERAELIVLHSPSHPLVDEALLRATVAAALEPGTDGAAPALAIHDMLKRVDPTTHFVTDTHQKADVRITQMPMAFRAGPLRAALAEAAAHPDVTDAQSLVERCGGRVRLVEGDPRNLHVTTRAELDLVRRLA